MRRSSMPPRQSPMRRSTELTRTRMKAKRRRKTMGKDLRGLVLALAAGLCDMCGLPLPVVWECHHRRLRSQGGRDERENLLALHDRCHSRAHLNRFWARAHGYIVERPDEPATRPVWRHGRSWQIPTATGWIDCDPPADLDLPTERTA